MKPEVESRALRHMVPGLARRFTPLSLAALPTPVIELPGLADAWGLKALHVKCDDRSSPIYGGSKVRGLEWLLGDAAARGAPGVLTIGPWGSHHAMATAVHAREVGLDARLVLFPQPSTGELAASRKALAAVAVVRECGWVGLPWAWMRARAAAWARGDVVVPAGGSSALGVLGNVEAGLEVTRAIEAGALEPPDVVVVAAGSCGTAAGLLLGLSLGGYQGRLTVVRVTPGVIASVRRVQRLAGRAASLIARHGGDVSGSRVELDWVGTQAGAGYARETPDALAAERAVAQHGLRLETTYTAKAMAHVRSLGGARVLFWNTYAGPRGSVVDREKKAQGAT